MTRPSTEDPRERHLDPSADRRDDRPEPVAIESLDHLAELVSARPGLHLRYADTPGDADTAASVDYESDLRLPGWSATVLEPEPWWTRPLVDWLARQVCKYVQLADKSGSRQAWVIRGAVVGRGPDHEPLLDRIEPVGRLSADAIAEARERYVRRFQVGRDSADGSAEAGSKDRAYGMNGSDKSNRR